MICRLRGFGIGRGRDGRSRGSGGLVEGGRGGICFLRLGVFFSVNRDFFVWFYYKKDVNFIYERNRGNKGRGWRREFFFSLVLFKTFYRVNFKTFNYDGFD